MRTVIVSGMHSEMNPSSGVGVTRSLHAAWPDLSVFGLDYSTRSSGLNLPELAGALIMPSLGSVDVEVAAQSLVQLAEERDAVYISGLDLEARILAGVCPDRILVPPVAAFEWIRKESLTPLGSVLGIHVPHTRVIDDIPSAAAEAEASGWRMWVKGPNYEAFRSLGTSTLERSVAELESSWGSPALLQQDIRGREASYCLSADQGTLLAACRMDKRQTTSLGKTWAGDVRTCNSRELSMLKTFVELTGWTGGAELEFVVDNRTEIEYLIDVNPRFPAWVHGATLAGINLPAELIRRHLGRALPPSKSQGPSFTRIVVEVPQLVAGVRPVGLDPAGHQAGKVHPSGMAALARALTRDDATRAHSLSGHRIDLPKEVATPVRHFLPDVLQARLTLAQQTLDEAAHAMGVRTELAYSMKTNPRSEVLELVRNASAGIECISRAEVSKAGIAAFRPERIILNGPGKWWPQSSTPMQVGLTFADSVEDLERMLDQIHRGMLQTSFVGIRVRPPRLGSRFGVDLNDREDFTAVAGLLSRIPRDCGFGMHFHHAVSAVGAEEWLDNFEGALELFASICSLEPISPAVVDIGGGWPAHMKVEHLRSVWESACGSAASTLGGEIRVIAEPGKMLVEPAMVLIARILEVHRKGGGIRSIVVDAAVNLLPDSSAPSRPVLWRRKGSDRWTELATGNGEILGRICMENDRLRRMVGLPSGMSEGDMVAFLGAGAYDESMAYGFAC